MTLSPFPPVSDLRWRRLDLPGREEARIEQRGQGRHLTGRIEVEESGVSARLEYRIACDLAWCTRSVLVEGEAAGGPVRFALNADGAGRWTCDDRVLTEVSGALDIDLGFTPATNTLPIRRLSLAVGETAAMRAVWLRFPELRLEALEQRYTCEAERAYRYEASIDGETFSARLDTDEYGRVLRYEGLWEMLASG